MCVCIYIYEYFVSIFDIVNIKEEESEKLIKLYRSNVTRWFWDCSFLVCTDSPPEIVTSPDAGMIQLVGSTKSLTCSAAGSPNPVYSWIQNDVYYKNYSRNDVNMKTLRIVNLQENDSGMFRCLASNSLGAELSQAAEIKVAGENCVALIKWKGKWTCMVALVCVCDGVSKRYWIATDHLITNASIVSLVYN